MSKRNVFEELSRFMPEHERDALLNSLKRSVHAEDESRDQMYHRDIGEDERGERLEKDLSNLSFFSRILLWFRSKFGNKSIKDAYIALRVTRLKRVINAKYPGITGFETRDLNPSLAEEIFRIYVVAVPLREYFKQVWTNPLDLQNMIVGVLEERIPEVKLSILELITMDELEQVIRTTDSREAVREEAGSRLESYFSSIPKSVFASLQEDLKPFERMRDFVLYPFTSFFHLFHFTPLEEDIAKKTYFKVASAMLCLEHLEELHHALFSVTKIGEHYELANDILIYMGLLKGDSSNEPSSSPPLTAATEGRDETGGETESAETESRGTGRDETAEASGSGDSETVGNVAEANVDAGNRDTSDAHAKNISELMAKLIERCRIAFAKLPIQALIRYFMKDPYYELISTIEETSVRDLYVSILRLRFMAELDSIYPELRKRVLEKEIQELFAGKTLRTFRNYREYKSIDYEKLGLPFFVHTRSVMLLFNYIQWFYKDFVQEAVQLLDRNVLGQNRITRDRLSQYARSVEETSERIRQFDYSLSSDSDDGRTFQRLRYTLAQDAGHQKTYRTLVIQKDREVHSIIERGAESLNGLVRVFKDLLESSSPNIRASMQNHYFVAGQPVSLDQIVQDRIDHIQKFTRLLDQVVRLERV